MATFRKTTPSNNTGLNIAIETYPGVLPSELAAPTTNNWLPMEPNSYSDFGADLELVAREPISADRQRKKGVIVGLEASGGFEHDLTPSRPLQEIIAGFFFSNIRVKNEIDATAVTTDGFTVIAGGDVFRAGDIIFVENAAIATNNGVHYVGAGSIATNVAVAGLVAETNPDITIVRVGFRFTAADAVIASDAGILPSLTTTAKLLTQLGIIPGEIVFLGGDGAADRFASEENSGWCRVKSVADNVMVFDKTDVEFVDDVGTGKTVCIYFGRVVKNEVGALIKRKTYRIERTLGAPDLDAPNAMQADYLIGAVANELTIDMPDKNKATLDLGFMAQDYATRTSVEGLLPGNRDVLPEQDVYNTSGDMKRQRLSVYPAPGSNTSAPEPLFALIMSFSLDLSNNLEMNTAQRYIGAVEITEGMFEFSGSMSAYFVGVAATQAIRDNGDVTYDFAMWKNNKGMAFDMPMIALGDGRLEIESNKAIMVPLNLQASNGAKYDRNMNHTALVSFFDYLPNLANRRVD